MTIVLSFVLILVFLFLLVNFEKVSREALTTHYTGPIRTDGSIFVSVASYRDINCSNTLEELYTKARDPNKIFVGLVQQNKLKSEDCTYYNANVRNMSISYRKAKGPCYARYLASSLYTGEQYFFQIDSHTRFEQGWDTDLRRYISALPKMCILSHYPQSWYNMKDKYVPVNDTPIRVHSYYKYKAHNISSVGENQFKQGLGVAGGFMFMRGEVLLEVPFDKHLDWVFTGEEFLYSARLYTRGYKFYSPPKNVAYHYYKREQMPKFQHDHSFRPLAPVRRVEQRIKNPPVGYYGVVKTVDDYYKFLASNLAG
jgi:[Skp1-protein]-hydroxyproline N-acetylglucosaminyltransferase